MGHEATSLSMPSLEWVELLFRVPLCRPHDAMIQKGKTSACVKDTIGLLKKNPRRIHANQNIYYPQKRILIILHNHLFIVLAVNLTQIKTFETKYSSQALALPFFSICAFRMKMEDEILEQLKYMS
jgi:hypothetical protein